MGLPRNRHLRSVTIPRKVGTATTHVRVLSSGIFKGNKHKCLCCPETMLIHYCKLLLLPTYLHAIDVGVQCEFFRKILVRSNFEG